MLPAHAVPEATREEETLRYAASLLSESVLRDAPGQDASLPVDPPDQTLTAFAQLGALGLKADHVFISLFDSKRQHVVAEASCATVMDGGPGEDPELASTDHEEKIAVMAAGTAIPRGHSICELVLDLPPAVVEGEPTLPLAMVSDTELDDCFPSRVYFRPGTALHFYAGVPIRSPQGIDIGVCCILSKEPRDGLTLPQQQLLRRISHLSMTHLTSRVTVESYRRNERMVRGLGSLVEGTASMSKWRGGLNPSSFSDIEGKEGALNAQQQHIQRFGRSEVTYNSPPNPTDSFESIGGMDSTDSNGNMTSDDNKGKHSFTTYPENQADEDLVVLKLLFSRASNIIRESIEVEGALFVDASIGSYGGLVQRAPKHSDEVPMSSSSSGNESAVTEDANEGTPYCGILGFSHSLASSINGDSPQSQHARIPEGFLARILRRYPEGQIFNFTEEGTIRWAVSSESDDSGEELKTPEDDIQSPIERSEPSRRGRDAPRYKRARKGDGAIIMRLFPQARSVAVFPLWDSHKEKWHAAGFVWTMSASRVFTITGELSYLRAFGSTVMADVARIDVLRADKAKEDVLGSLSHEIRSPLHGIILGLELMHDTTLNVFQQEVLHTVETCGRTLLDTIDHLLDYSKVNHFLQGPKRTATTSRSRGMVGSPNRGNAIEAGMMSLFTDVSLDSLLEEVVESIYAGFSFQQSSADWAVRDRGVISSVERAGTLRRLESVRHTDANLPVDMKKLKASVDIYLSIDPTVSWNFHAQPGALRRIIMNIFGNALKYTQRGSILVSLTQENSHMKRKSRRRSIIFSVSDSGRGISAEFLQNRLFVPFTQENQLVSGSGLGLSIVKQIVHGLGGRIGVESKVGHGTTVRVSLPLRISTATRASPTSPLPSAHRDVDFFESLKQLQGVKVTLFGFEMDFGPDKPLAADSADARLCPRLFMETLCCHYLKLNVLSELDAAFTDPSPSILICTQSSLAKALSANHLYKVRPIVVICNTILAAHELSSKASGTSFPIYVPQPIGPRKLAKTLLVALQRQKDANAAESAGNKDNDEISPIDVQKSARDSTTSEGYFSRPSRRSSAVNMAPSGARPSGSSSRSDTPTPSSVLPDSIKDIAEATQEASSFKTERPRPVALQSRPSSPQPSYHEPPTPPQEGPTMNANTFLLVDDNAINLKILAWYMKKLDRSHDNAMNGLEALDACRSRHTHYKCIFMDISMPVMDGLEATRHIRAHEKQQGWDPALIIALTGLGSSKTQQEAFASGIDLFLTKPVPLKELGSILESRNV